MVLGHEIIGRVVSVGSDVTRFKPGNHVGVSCMVDSCLRCAACGPGLEQYCKERPTLTYNDLDVHFVNSLPLLEVARVLKPFIFKGYKLAQDL